MFNQDCSPYRQSSSGSPKIHPRTAATLSLFRSCRTFSSQTWEFFRFFNRVPKYFPKSFDYTSWCWTLSSSASSSLPPDCSNTLSPRSDQNIAGISHSAEWNRSTTFLPQIIYLSLQNHFFNNCIQEYFILITCLVNQNLQFPFLHTLMGSWFWGCGFRTS